MADRINRRIVMAARPEATAILWSQGAPLELGERRGRLHRQVLFPRGEPGGAARDRLLRSSVR